MKIQPEPNVQETRRLLTEHEAKFGPQPLTIPYSIMHNMLATHEAYERQMRNVRLVLLDARNLAQDLGGEHLMLARRITVLLGE